MALAIIAATMLGSIVIVRALDLFMMQKPKEIKETKYKKKD
jgi:hypothetical protein